jgi:hypothetical protein
VAASKAHEDKDLLAVSGISLPPVFVNTVLLGHNIAHSLDNCPWLFSLYCVKVE